MGDIFGDLREWGRVLTQIEQLRQAGYLEEHQAGLARVLRYPCNWQLRQAGLKAVSGLRKPSKEVLEVLLSIASDENCDMETRLLACDAVSHVISRLSGLVDSGNLESEVLRRAHQLLDSHQPPLLRLAIERWRVQLHDTLVQHA